MNIRGLGLVNLLLLRLTRVDGGLLGTQALLSLADPLGAQASCLRLTGR